VLSHHLNKLEKQQEGKYCYHPPDKSLTKLQTPYTMADERPASQRKPSNLQPLHHDTKTALESSAGHGHHSTMPHRTPEEEKAYLAALTEWAREKDAMHAGGWSSLSEDAHSVLR